MSCRLSLKLVSSPLFKPERLRVGGSIPPPAHQIRHFLITLDTTTSTACSHQYRRRMSACATKPDNLRARSNVGFWPICDIRALLMAVWVALRGGSFNATRIIHGREQECSPSAVLSLYPKGTRVLFRISSLGPDEPASVPPEYQIRTAETVGSAKRSPSGSSS